MPLPEADYPAVIAAPIPVRIGRELVIEMPTKNYLDAPVDWTGVGTWRSQAVPEVDPFSTPLRPYKLDFAIEIVGGVPVLTLTGAQTAEMLPQRGTFWKFDVLLTPVGETEPVTIVEGTLLPRPAPTR